jgi:hypothetical protein
MVFAEFVDDWLEVVAATMISSCHCSSILAAWLVILLFVEYFLPGYDRLMAQEVNWQKQRMRSYNSRYHCWPSHVGAEERNLQLDNSWRYQMRRMVKTEVLECDLGIPV